MVDGWASSFGGHAGSRSKPGTAGLSVIRGIGYTGPIVQVVDGHAVGSASQMGRMPTTRPAFQSEKEISARERQRAEMLGGIFPEGIILVCLKGRGNDGKTNVDNDCFAGSWPRPWSRAARRRPQAMRSLAPRWPRPSLRRKLSRARLTPTATVLSADAHAR